MIRYPSMQPSMGHQFRVEHRCSPMPLAYSRQPKVPLCCRRSLVVSRNAVEDVIHAHVAALLSVAVSITAVVPPAVAVIPDLQGSTSLLPVTVQQHAVQAQQYIASAPDVHADEQQQQQQWWTADGDVWLELTTPAEVNAFLHSTQAPPAWPALSSDSLSPKLRIIEFYAGWCPACKAAAPGLAAVASDPQLTAVCSFARANVDRVKPLLKQLGIRRIPTALLLSPSGEVLDELQVAGGQVVRDAILLHSAALRQTLPPATQELLPPPALPSPAEQLPPSDVDTDSNGGSSNDSNSTVGSEASSRPLESATSGADGPAACSATPDVAATCGPLPPGVGVGLPPLDKTAPPPLPASAATPAAGATAAAGPAIGTAAAAGDAALAAAKQQFLQRYGAGYGYSGWLEQHYQAEVGLRLGPGRHYLDYTGSALYPASLLQAVYSDLMSHTYGNPHSAAAAASGGPGSAILTPAPAAASAEVLDEAALAVLHHLNADPAEYQVVFTRSATEALKLVGEMYPWKAGSGGSSSSRFIYTRSNHNSVLGIGAYAAAAGAELQPMSDEQMAAWLSAAAQSAQPQVTQPEQQQQQQDRSLLASLLRGSQQPQTADSPAAHNETPAAADEAGGADGVTYSLVAYPAQDNFAGIMYPLDWIQQAHSASGASERFLVLLDAAAFLPSHPLDLTAHPADFVAASFYKMFGYPTGLGALLVRTELVPLLNKVYFGGGSVALATPEGCWHAGKCDPAARLSDGTPNFLGAAALLRAYENWDARGGMRAVEQHTQALSAWLHEQLSSLRHSNGAPLLQLYGRHGQQQQVFGQGSIFNFQVLGPDSSPVSYSRVEREAEAAGISLRSGCVCNPGACYDALGLTSEEVQALAGVKEGCGDDVEFTTVLRPAAAGGDVEVQVPLGSVRASLGWASTFEDAYALVAFLKGYLS